MMSELRAGLGERLTGEMVGERLGFGSGKAEVEKHEDLFVGRKA